jgi:hypothetical protein
MKDLKELYKNYLHSIMLDAGLCEAFKNMCKAYKKDWTYYLQSSKVDQQEKGKRRETFSIGWLKPLQVTSNTNFIFLCQKATVSRVDEVQKLYFDGHSKGAIDLTTYTLLWHTRPKVK